MQNSIVRSFKTLDLIPRVSFFSHQILTEDGALSSLGYHSPLGPGNGHHDVPVISKCREVLATHFLPHTVNHKRYANALMRDLTMSGLITLQSFEHQAAFGGVDPNQCSSLRGAYGGDGGHMGPMPAQRAG
jgi:hypothetical protein